MAADDEAKPTTPGLPDPSQRVWRHPSEMGGTIDVPTTATAPQGVFADSVAGKGLFGIVVLLVAVATTFQLAGGSDPGPADDLARSADDGPSASDNDSERGSTSPRPLPDLTADRPDSFAERKAVRQGSLFVTADAETPVASVVMVGDVMVTSASAVENYLELWLDHGRARTPMDIDVIGVDRFADIAVLTSPDSTNNKPGSDVLSEELATLAPFDLARVEAVVVGDPADSTDTRNGAVIGWDESVSHYSGHTIYSAIITSIPFDDHLAGAPLTTPRGDLVGFVVNAAGAVVTAVPVDDVIRLARTLLAISDANDPNFALELEADARGRAVVADVNPDGPFADALSNGDVVVAVDGVQLLNTDHLTHLIRRIDPGASAVFTVEGAEGRFDATLALDEPHLAIDPTSQP